MNQKIQLLPTDHIMAATCAPQQKSLSKASLQQRSCLHLGLLLFVIITSVLFNRIAHAQLSDDSKKLSAVVSVVSAYLLEEGVFATSIELPYNGFDSGFYPISETFDVSFPRSNQDIEFCFILSSRTNLQLTINGVIKNIRSGENCLVITTANQLDTNEIQFSYTTGTGDSQISSISVASQNPSRSELPSLTRSEWDERAVRKVLKIFAFGGQARDSQIEDWADMRPYDAIRQMLTFAEHNPLLSSFIKGETYRSTSNKYGTLREFLSFISDTTSTLPIPAENREHFGINGYLYDEAFLRMATVRGLNPFRQRIGFWETNYHLAVNLDASVSKQQMTEYYDLIMEAHEANLPYYEVMGIAAKSAAVAMQYGHRENRWNATAGICECNQDFAREIHQLYYGIFGEGDSDHHENVTIPETAKMLTGMPLNYIQDFGFPLEVDFADGVADGHHHMAGVNILRSIISGSDAERKIDKLMPISMQHPESLQNLPIMIISVLADDNLDDFAKNQLRESWASLGVNRKLLDFIHAYAISDLFHSTDQYKYLTSHERALYLANKRNLDNVEAYSSGDNYEGHKGRDIGGIIEDDFAGDVFKPLRNVFGGQTSTEASDSAVAFENNHNDIVARENWQLTEVLCDTCDNGYAWEKKWSQVLPKRNGKFYVEDVAEWLWMHTVGNLDNYTELEKAHLYPLLAAISRDPNGSHQDEYFFDLNYLMCVVADYQYQENASDAPIFELLTADNWYNFPYCREEDGIAAHEEEALNATLTGLQIANDAEIQSILSQLGQVTIPLNEDASSEAGKTIRRYALERIDTALDFIFTTPFVFAEGE